MPFAASTNDITSEGCPLDGIDLSTIDTDDEDLMVALKKTYRCSGCIFGIRTGHIHSCKRGHNMCEDCYHKLEKDERKCPKCESLMDPCRNFSLERILPYVPKPCQYASKGCTFSIPCAKALVCHEFECRFRPINCFYCKKEVMMNELMDHFEEEKDHEVIHTEFGKSTSIFYTLKKLLGHSRGVSGRKDSEENECKVYAEVCKIEAKAKEESEKEEGEEDKDEEEEEEDEDEEDEEEEEEEEEEDEEEEEEDDEDEEEDDEEEEESETADSIQAKTEESYRCFVVEDIVFYFISRTAGPLWKLWAFVDVTKCDLQNFAYDIKLGSETPEEDRVDFCNNCLSINRRDILDKELVEKPEIDLIEHISLKRNDILCLGRGAPMRFSKNGLIEVKVTYHDRRDNGTE